MNNYDMESLSNAQVPPMLSNCITTEPQRTDVSRSQPFRGVEASEKSALQPDASTSMPNHNVELEKIWPTRSSGASGPSAESASPDAGSTRAAEAEARRAADCAAVGRFFEIEPRGLVSLTQVRSATGLSEGRAVQALATLISSGVVERLGLRGRVYHATTGARPLTPPTVAQLRELVSASAHGATRVRRHGPASREERAQRTELTPSQAKDCLTALNHLSRRLELSADVPLPSEVFRYEPRTNAWAIIGLIDLECAELTRVGGPLSPSARAKIRSSLRLLLDLAANHGVVVPSEASTELSVAWLRWLPSTKEGRTRRLRVTCRRLAEEALRLGYHDPATVDWYQVAKALRRKPLDSRDRQHLKDSVTAFRALGHPGLPPAKRSGQAPVCLVPIAAIREAIRGDWRNWRVGEAGAHLASLVGGPSGLAAWVAWTQAGSEVALHAAGLPTKRELSLAGGVPAYGSDAVPPIGTATLTARLRAIGTTLATVLRRHGNEHVVGLCAGDLVTSQYAALLDTKSYNGFVAGLTALADLANFAARTALAANDIAGAVEFLEQEERLRQSVPKRGRQDREKVTTVVGAFGRDATEAWDTLMAIRDRHLEHITRTIGMSVTDQLASMDRGEIAWQTASWAKRVRDAMLLNLCIRVPLRRGTANALRLWLAGDPLIDDVSAVWKSSHSERPWEGALSLDCSPGCMKSGVAFHPAIMLDRSVGDSLAEASLRRAVFALYLHPLGARAMLLGRGKEDHGWMWLRSGGHRLRGSNVIIRRLICSYGPALGVDIDRLAAVGGLGLHAIRHIFGSRLAPHALVPTSKLLSHRNTAITERYYCSFSAAEADVDAALDTARNRGGGFTSEAAGEPLW